MVVHVPGAVFQLLAEHYIDPLFFTADGVVQWIAPSIESTLGWTPGELRELPLTQFVHDDDIQGMQHLLARIVEGEAGRGVFRLRTKAGEYLWVLVTVGSAASSADAGEVGLVGSIREINLRAEVERRLRLVAEHTSDVLLTTDADQRIVWVSSSVRRILGWDTDDLVGSCLEDLMDSRDRRSREVPQLASADGQPIGGTQEATEVRIRDRLGGYRWMRLTARHLGDSEEGVDSTIIGLQDVDELLRARDHMADYAKRLRTIIDTNPDVHLVLGPVRDESGAIVDFILQEINAAGAAYTGIPRSQLLGRRLSEVLPTYRDSPFLPLEIEVMETGQPLALDDLLIPSFEVTGADAWVSLRAVRVGDSLSVVWRDVTDRVRQVRLIEESEEKYRLLAENVTDVVMRLRHHVVEWVSPSLADTLGWTPEDWTGRDLHDFFHVDDLSAHEAVHERLGTGEKVTYRSRLRGKDLSYHWADIAEGPFVNAQGDVDGLVASFRLVDVEVAAEAALDRRARFDELTGLANRTEVLSRLESTPGHHRRPGDETAILFCDVDRFKDINDTYGHAAGDRVLRTLADRLAAAIRTGDTAARVGGDELMAVLEGVHDIDDALRVAEKIRAAASLPITTSDQPITTSMSIGVTLAVPGESTDSLIARADEAMYQAKKRGRNLVFTLNGSRS